MAGRWARPKTRAAADYGRVPLGRWESKQRMEFLCALLCGERIAVAASEHLVVTSKGDPTKGCLVTGDDLASLERRGWVEMAGDAESAVITPRGRAMARLWFRQTHGGAELVRVLVRDEVSPLLRREVAPC